MHRFSQPVSLHLQLSILLLDLTQPCNLSAQARQLKTFGFRSLNFTLETSDQLGVLLLEIRGAPDLFAQGDIFGRHPLNLMLLQNDDANRRGQD